MFVDANVRAYEAKGQFTLIALQRRAEAIAFKCEPWPCVYLLDWLEEAGGADFYTKKNTFLTLTSARIRAVWTAQEFSVHFAEARVIGQRN